MICEGNLNENKAAKSLDGGMTDALEITLKVQLNELKQWDEPAYNLLLAMSFVASYISLLDTEVHWPIMQKIYKKMGPVTRLQNTIELLVAKKLISPLPKKGWKKKLPEKEMLYVMNANVKAALVPELETKMLSVMFYYYCTQVLQNFYFTYKKKYD